MVFAQRVHDMTEALNDEQAEYDMDAQISQATVSKYSNQLQKFGMWCYC